MVERATHQVGANVLIYVNATYCDGQGLPMYSAACLVNALGSAPAYATLRVTPGDWVNATGSYLVNATGLVLEAEQSGVNDPSTGGGLVYLIGPTGGQSFPCLANLLPATSLNPPHLTPPPMHLLQSTPLE